MSAEVTVQEKTRRWRICEVVVCPSNQVLVRDDICTEGILLILLTMETLGRGSLETQHGTYSSHRIPLELVFNIFDPTFIFLVGHEWLELVDSLYIATYTENSNTNSN